MHSIYCISAVLPYQLLQRKATGEILTQITLDPTGRWKNGTNLPAVTLLALCWCIDKTIGTLSEIQ
jgi:hypothetical protein